MGTCLTLNSFEFAEGTNMKYKNLLLVSLGTLLIASPALRADTGYTDEEPAVAQDVANHLSELEAQASKVGRHAESLWMISRSHHTARDSHAYYMNNLMRDINSMGQLLAELEQMKPQATESQKMAIDNARLHLVTLADKTTEARDLLRAGGENVKQTQYKETVAELSRQADIFHQELAR